MTKLLVKTIGVTCMIIGFFSSTLSATTLNQYQKESGSIQNAYETENKINGN